MDYVIELDGVTKDYGDFVLDHVSFQVPEGCICGFIGQNGAGKTTTISLILDIVKKNSGTIKVFGKEMAKNEEELKQEIGIVFDEMGFHDFMTPLDINLMLKNIYTNWSEEKFFSYLKRFSLPMKKKCVKFSRGMRMKLQIAAAMAHNPRLLIMDEPTSGLDPIVRNEILQLFQEYVMEENHTILLSSHITGDLERIADMVVFINNGKIVLSGNKDEILESHRLLKCKKEDLKRVNEDAIVGTRQSAFGVEALICNTAQYGEEQSIKESHNAKETGSFESGNRSQVDFAAITFQGAVLEQSTLEEIMIFYVLKQNSEKK